MECSLNLDILNKKRKSYSVNVKENIKMKQETLKKDILIEAQKQQNKKIRNNKYHDWFLTHSRKEVISKDKENLKQKLLKNLLMYKQLSKIMQLGSKIIVLKKLKII